MVKISSYPVKDNPDFFEHDEDHDGDWHDYFLCPNCKKNYELTYIDKSCYKCNESIEWDHS